MKPILVIMFIVLLGVGASLYFYFDGSNEELSLGNNNVNLEHKQAQDDKDTVVDTNKAVLAKFSALEKTVAEMVKSSNKQNERIESIEKDNSVKTNNKTDNRNINANDIVKKVIATINKGLPTKSQNDNSGTNYKINNPQGDKQGYIWENALHSDDHSDGVGNSDTQIHQNVGSSNNNIDSFDAPLDHKSKLGLQKTGKDLESRAAYTIPRNSILSGVLTTGLIGRIPVDGEVTDPFRFNIKISGNSFYANNHSNKVLQGVIASGTASGDLLLSCVRANIDSITFIFEDGTINNNDLSETETLGYIANDNGYPCIKGELVTNAAQYIGASALFSGLSGGAKAFSESQKTTTNNTNGSSSSSVTGSPYKLLGASLLSGATEDTQKWINARAKSSFDVVFVPSGKSVKILTSKQINIDYDPNGRKLDHALFTGGSDEIHELD